MGISEETGMKLEEVKPEQLGKCKKVEIDKNSTVVLGGSGDSVGLRERCDLIRHSIETTKSDYEREKLQERLAKLSGGVAVIRVGGASEVEVSEKKDRFIDALNATRADVEEGIVPGGGKALLYCSTKLTDLAEQAPNMDQRIGIEIIQRALRTPLFTIAKNAGEEGAVIVGELLKSTEVEQGFDAQKGEYCNLVNHGIIDPTKVVRTGLVDAASVGGLLTTSEAMIVDSPDDNPPPAPPMGGM